MKSGTWTRIPLAALLALTLAACGGTGPSPAETGEAGEAAASSGAAASGEAASPGENEITMRDIIDANRTPLLLEKYGSVRVDYTYAEDPDPEMEYLQTVYVDGEVTYQGFNTARELYTGEGDYLYSDGVYGMPLTTEPVTAPGKEHVALEEGLTAEESIVTVEEGEDGTLTVVTRLDGSMLSELYGGAYDDLEYSGETYVLNSDLEILSDVSGLFYEDGTSETVGQIAVTYGEARPADAEDLYSRLHAEEKRTVTAVLDPGTEDERSVSVTPMKGDSAFNFLPEGYDVWYADPDCTVPFTPPETQDEDVTFYVPYTPLEEE